MEKKIAPSAGTAQALRALVQGQHEAQSGEELLSTCKRSRGRTEKYLLDGIAGA